MSKFIDLSLFHDSFDDHVPYDYQIIPNEENNDVLITLPESIKIWLVDFNPNKSLLLNTLADKSLNVSDVLSVSYPLKPSNFLQILKLSKTEEDITEVICILWIGIDFSMKLPYLFGEKLQNFLLTGELINE